MADKLSEILKKGEIESEAEHDIVFADWARLMDARASIEDMQQHNELLRAYEDEQEED